MRRSRKLKPAQRLLALLLTVLLWSGIAVDAYALDPCPHHSLAAPSADTVPAQTAHSGHARHPDLGATAGTSLSVQDQDGGEHDHAAACTCRSACSGTAAIVVPHAPSLPAACAQHAADSAVPPSPDAPASLHLDLLPYSNAPPASPSSIQA